MEHNSTYIEYLKNDIERKLGRSLKSPVDFNYLSTKLQKELNETLSISTLQRLWNYVSSPSQPRISTLSILSRFLGYTCWDDYLASYIRNNASESSYITAKIVRTHDLHVGDLLHIGWKPDRELKIRYLGDYYFEVIASENSKLKVGNTFLVMSFSMGNPLTITKLTQGNRSNLEYIAGKKNGLTILEILSPSTQAIQM